MSGTVRRPMRVTERESVRGSPEAKSPTVRGPRLATHARATTARSGGGAKSRRTSAGCG